MIWKYFFVTLGLITFVSAKTFSQDDWVLKTDKEGIKVYTKGLENSSLKVSKTVCVIDASLSRLTAVLMDINTAADWVYSTKKATLLKQANPTELYYYSEVSVPWPASNRDFVVLMKVSQDEKTKAVTVVGENKPTYLPAVKNIVRIQQSYTKWLIMPLQNGQVQIEYYLQVDPGGIVPAWLINMFSTKGPFETFKNLRLQVKKDIYKKMSVPFIRD